MNEWTHLACTYDRVDARVYVNGAEVASAPVTEAIISSPQSLSIGIEIESPTRNFDGLIDEVEIFNRALSAAEVGAIYEAGSSGKIKPQPDPPGEPIQPPVGMVGWWPGDGDAEDIWDGNPGTLVGGATFTGGMVNQAFSFDGVDDYLDLGNPGNLNITGDLAVELWFRIDSQKYNVLAAKGVGLVGNEWYVRQRGDTGEFLEWAIQDTNLNTVSGATSSPIAAGSFHHLALVRSGATGRLYLDGVQVDSDSNPAFGDISNPYDILIGADSRLGTTGAPHFAVVTIDEVEIFNRALRGEEIRAIYNAGSAGKIRPQPPEPIPPPPGMVSWWPADGHTTDIIDGNHGLLQGGATFAPGMVGQSFSFDGDGDFVDVGNPANLNFGTGDFSIDLWFKPNVSTNIHIVGKDTFSGNLSNHTGYFLQYIGNGKVRFATRDLVSGSGPQNYLDSNLTVPVGQFTHLGAVRENDVLKLYINGVLDNTLSESSPTDVSTSTSSR